MAKIEERRGNRAADNHFIMAVIGPAKPTAHRLQHAAARKFETDVDTLLIKVNHSVRHRIGRVERKARRQAIKALIIAECNADMPVGQDERGTARDFPGLRLSIGQRAAQLPQRGDRRVCRSSRRPARHRTEHETPGAHRR